MANDSLGQPDVVGLVRSVTGPATGRWGKRLATATAAYSASRLGLQAVRNYRSARMYSVTVVDTEQIYGVVQEAVLALMPEQAQRALVARTTTVRNVSPTPEDYQPERKVSLHYDGSRTQQVTLSGQRIRIRVEREGSDSVSASAPGSSPIYRPHKVILEADTLAGRDAIVTFLSECAATLSDAKSEPRVVGTTKWGDWRTLKALQPRSLDTVVLPDGQLDALLADLRTFLAAEATYARYGLPWHRGYLLAGPPGTGKTSLAQAIAGNFGMDTYVLALSDLEGDASLAALMGAIPTRAVLLLEDVDVARAATKRNDDRSGATLQGLLNSLDGLTTPHGLVTIMTTNYADRLAPALIRPGRVDHRLDLTYATPNQAAELIEQVTGIPTTPRPTIARLTTAQIMGALRNHLHNPTRARQAALALLSTQPNHKEPTIENG